MHTEYRLRTWGGYFGDMGVVKEIKTELKEIRANELD
jgi:hypothetical protein